MPDELKTLIANQLKRRNRMMSQLTGFSPAPTKVKKSGSGKKNSYLIYALLGLVQLIGILLIVWETIIVSKPVRAFPPSPTAIPVTESVVSSIQITTALPDPMQQVCTNVSGGHLHVRFAPGEGSAVRGYLTEGETIQPALKNSGDFDVQRKSNGSSWIRLMSPIEGWANIRYICELK